VTLIVGSGYARLERCPVTDSQHRSNQASAFPAHTTPLSAASLQTSLNYLTP
jgi:hypothetical protein